MLFTDKPKIFIPSNDTLLEVLYEQHENFHILWFHFPKDGWLPIEDYEPIIFIYKNDKLQCLITRRHWGYQTYNIDDLVEPLEVLFDGSFHPPFPRTKDKYERFEEKIRNCEELDNYEISKIDANNISEKFRTGKEHPSLAIRFFRLAKDPIEQAKEILSNI